MIRDQVLLISCFVAGSAGGNIAAAHLINADLTGHAAADSQLPAAPAASKKKKKKPSAVSQRPHQREFLM